MASLFLAVRPRRGNWNKAYDSDWVRLFRSWERMTRDAQGFASAGDGSLKPKRTGSKAFLRSLGIVGAAIKEALELAAHAQHRRVASP